MLLYVSINIHFFNKMKSFIHQAYALIHSVQSLVYLRHFSLRQFYLRFCHKRIRSPQNKAQPRTTIKCQKTDKQIYCKIRKRYWNLDMVRCWWGFRIIYDIISCQNAISVHFPIVGNSNSGPKMDPNLLHITMTCQIWEIWKLSLRQVSSSVIFFELDLISSINGSLGVKIWNPQIELT